MGGFGSVWGNIASQLGNDMFAGRQGAQQLALQNAQMRLAQLQPGFEQQRMDLERQQQQLQQLDYGLRLQQMKQQTQKWQEEEAQYQQYQDFLKDPEGYITKITGAPLSDEMKQYLPMMLLSARTGVNVPASFLKGLTPLTPAEQENKEILDLTAQIQKADPTLSQPDAYLKAVTQYNAAKAPAQKLTPLETAEQQMLGGVTGTIGEPGTPGFQLTYNEKGRQGQLEVEALQAAAARAQRQASLDSPDKRWAAGQDLIDNAKSPEDVAQGRKLQQEATQMESLTQPTDTELKAVNEGNRQFGPGTFPLNKAGARAANLALQSGQPVASKAAVEAANKTLTTANEMIKNFSSAQKGQGALSAALFGPNANVNTAAQTVRGAAIDAAQKALDTGQQVPRELIPYMTVDDIKKLNYATYYRFKGITPAQ